LLDENEQRDAADRLLDEAWHEFPDDTLCLCPLKAGKRDDSINGVARRGQLAPQAAVPRLHLAQQLSRARDRIGAANALRSIDRALSDPAGQGSLAKLKTELGLS